MSRPATLQLWLVRHGQAAFDQEDYDQLSALGTRQAQALGRHWARSRIALQGLWQGGMRRHRQTAESCLATWAQAQAGAPQPLAAALPGFREFDHRALFFAHRPDLRDPAALRAWREGAGLAPGENLELRFTRTWQQAQQRWLSGQHPDDYEESWAEVRMRVHAAVHALHALAAQQAIHHVFTSAGPISALLQLAQGLPDDAVPAVQGTLYNAGITCLEVPDPAEPQLWRITRCNDVEHLEVAELDRTLR